MCTMTILISLPLTVFGHLSLSHLIVYGFTDIGHEMAE